MPESKSPSNPTPAPPAGGAGKEGERQGLQPLPKYVISPQELKLLGWLKEAKTGDRIELLNAAPPQVPQGAVRVSGETKFYNFRMHYDKMKNTLIIKSRGYTFTVCPLKGVRVYADKKVLKEYSDCWASLLFSLVNKLLTEYDYNVFTEKWQTVSLPENKEVRKLVALLASMVNNKITELKDPFFRPCIDSKTP